MGVGVRVRWRVWAGGNREILQFILSFPGYGRCFCPRFSFLKKSFLFFFVFFFEFGILDWIGGRIVCPYHIIILYYNIILISSFAVVSTIVV